MSRIKRASRVSLLVSMMVLLLSSLVARSLLFPWMRLASSSGPDTTRLSLQSSREEVCTHVLYQYWIKLTSQMPLLRTTSQSPSPPRISVPAKSTPKRLSTPPTVDSSLSAVMANTSSTLPSPGETRLSVQHSTLSGPPRTTATTLLSESQP